MARSSPRCPATKTQWHAQCAAYYYSTLYTEGIVRLLLARYLDKCFHQSWWCRWKQADLTDFTISLLLATTVLLLLLHLELL
jgi:hypothetical protein